MFIPIDVPGAMRRNLIGAFADDPTIPYSPSWSRRLGDAVRSVAQRPDEDTHLRSAGATAATESC
jgi:hypothetical protein